MNIYVGNIPNKMTEEELTSAFEEFGPVQSLKILTDRDTGASRGFGFVEMADHAGRKAIEGLNDTEVGGRTLTVNVARERNSNNRRSY